MWFLKKLWGKVPCEDTHDWKPIPQNLIESLDEIGLSLIVEEDRAALVLSIDDHIGERLYLIKYSISLSYYVQRFVRGKENEWAIDLSKDYKLEELLDFFKLRIEKGYQQEELSEIPSDLN